MFPKPMKLYHPDDPPSGGITPPGTPPGSPPGTPPGEPPKVPPAPPPDDLDGEDFDKDRALATIRTQRESEKTLKAQVKQLQADLKVFQDKDNLEKEKSLSEQQKLEKKLADANEKLTRLEAENTKLLTFQEFSKKVQELGYSFVTPQAESDAFAFITGIEVKDGKIEGMEEAVKTLQKSRPYFFTGNGDGTPGTPPRGKRPSGTPPGKAEPVKINF